MIAVLSIILTIILGIMLTFLFVDYTDNHKVDLSIVKKYVRSSRPKKRVYPFISVDDAKKLSKEVAESMKITPLTYKGDWDKSIQYSIGDIVHHNGSDWVYDGSTWIRT